MYGDSTGCIKWLLAEYTGYLGYKYKQGYIFRFVLT